MSKRSDFIERVMEQPPWSFEEELEVFIRGCFDAVKFTTGVNPDRRLCESCLKNLRADCRSFFHRFCSFILTEEGLSEEGADTYLAGQDFWLTRNGHGGGFWDGSWPIYGDMLSQAAENYGEFCIEAECVEEGDES